MRVADMPDDERYVAEAILRAEQTWMVDLPKGFVARLTAQLALPARDAAIRISERRKVRAELLAMASLYERVGSRSEVPDVLNEAADRIAPETTKETSRTTCARAVQGRNPWACCPCGHPWIRHDVDERAGDGTDRCCVEGCDQVGCPGIDRIAPEATPVPVVAS